MPVQRGFSFWDSSMMHAESREVRWAPPPVVVESAPRCRSCRQPYCSCDVKRCPCHPRGVAREERERREKVALPAAFRDAKPRLEPGRKQYVVTPRAVPRKSTTARGRRRAA